MLQYHRSGTAIIGLLCIATALLCLGCSDNGVNQPDTLTTAWSAFETGELDDALSAFHAVIESDPASADGYNGLGWSFALRGQLDSSDHYFTKALKIDTASPPALAGESAVNLAFGYYGVAIDYAQKALSSDPEWSFAHDPTIDHYDLHLILAEAYFALGENHYPSALREVKAINPGTSLSPDDDATWDGHPTYAAALLKEIELLEAIVGGDMML